MILSRPGLPLLSMPRHPSGRNPTIPTSDSFLYSPQSSHPYYSLFMPLSCRTMTIFGWKDFVDRERWFFEIAENKQIIIQAMKEGALDQHLESFQGEGEKRQPCEEVLSPGAQSWGQKPDQQEQLKLRSVFSSQLTQENSGISYAFKAHVLITTFDRLRLRRLAKSIAACKTRITSRSGLLAAGSHSHSCVRLSGGRAGQGSDSGEHQRNQPVGEPLPPPELPSFGFLQQPNLKSSQKFLTRQLFESKLKVAALEGRVVGLEKQLAEAERRQEREMLKKRESLTSLAEELGDKNEIIEELKGVVRSLKAKLNLKQNSSALVLEEDTETLRKSLLHIQGVNDRLNFDLARTKQAQKSLGQQLKALAAQNDKLKADIIRLREESFDADSVREQAELGRRECALWERRLRTREERLGVLEKRVNEKARNNQSAGIIAYCTEKRFESISAPEPAHIDMSAKVEAILEFFFHIEEEDYSLRCEELFDAEEKELLQSQKAKICCRMESSNASRCLSPVKPKQEESQVVNFNFACSILDLIERESQKPVAAQEQSTSGRQEGEIVRLRERIGELKDSQLFVRSVLLSFIKSLELRSIKKESENILELLYDCFEYSEDERASLFQPKARKIFGFI